MMRRPCVPARVRGFTLVEALVALFVLALLALAATPTALRMLDRQRIHAAAEAILSDLRWARGEAIKRNQDVRVRFGAGATWSYSVAVAPFAAPDVIKSVDGTDFPGVTLDWSSFAGNPAFTTFDPARGTAAAGSVALSSRYHSAQVRVSALGRVRICGLTGYDPCP